MTASEPPRRNAWGSKTAQVIFWIIAAFYAYGAFVHVSNMLGFRGTAWLDWPLKWQALDVVYLILDVIVVVGFLRTWRPAVAAFFAAALSQIVLYTVFRDWIIDVPAEIAPTAEEVSYLDTLVGFHVVAIALVLIALWLRRSNAPPRI